MLDVALLTFAVLGCCALAAIRIAKSRGMLGPRKGGPIAATVPKQVP